MPSDRPSSIRFPGGVNAQLLTAVVLALGIGGSGGSLLAGSNADLDRRFAETEGVAEQRYATKLELSSISSDLALLRQELAQVSAQLESVSVQLVKMEEQLRAPIRRR